MRSPPNVPIGNWVKALHDNAQLEAITLFKPDTLIAFAEAKVNPGEDLLAAMESYPNAGGPPATRMLSVVPHDPFAITGVANAPDGGLYLLERRFSLVGGVGMELRHIGPSEIHEGARMNGEMLANLSFQDANIDNMEGLAVRRGPKGETLLYIISDDNYFAAAADAALDVRGEERQLSRRSGFGLRLLLGDLALQAQRLGRKPFIARLEQEHVQPAVAVDGPERVHADFQRHILAERVARQAHRLKIGPEHPLLAVVGMAHQMSAHDTFSRQFAAACHDPIPLRLAIVRSGSLKEAAGARQACPRAALCAVPGARTRGAVTPSRDGRAA